MNYAKPIEKNYICVVTAGEQAHTGFESNN